jgi:hypothetical protein
MTTEHADWLRIPDSPLVSTETKSGCCLNLFSGGVIVVLVLLSIILTFTGGLVGEQSAGRRLHH